MRQLLHALRTLARTPAFTLLSILTLAIGIAATTAIFSVVNGVLLRPLPYPQPERLVNVSHEAPGLHLDSMGMSDALYFHYLEHARALEGLALVDDRSASLTGSGEPERLAAVAATASLFSVLRASPAFGRAFTEDEERPGATPVVILSDELWRRRFGGDPGILGRTLEIDGVAREVIGVMPPGFRYPFSPAELWLPMPLDPASTRLGAFGTDGIARLRPGVDLDAAVSDLTTDLKDAFPGERAGAILTRAGFKPRLVPVRDVLVGRVEATLWLLLGAVGFVLLGATANVANLFLVRADGRQREMAVRSALGATRAQLVRRATAESLTLSVAAGVLGLGGALLAVHWLLRSGDAVLDLPRLHEIAVDGRVVAFCAGAAILTGLVFGLLPAGARGLHDVAAMLKEGGRSATSGRRRHLLRNALVVTQVTIAVVLLICSGLLVRSFLRVADVDPGFRDTGVLTAQVALPESHYPDDVAAASFFTRLLEKVRGLSGVTAAGAISILPLTNQFQASGHVIEGVPLEDDGLPPVIGYVQIAPGTLETLGIGLRAGRGLELRDQEQRAAVVVVSESVARAYWPGQNAVGKRIANGRPSEERPDPWLTVVGVVDDVHVTSLTEEPEEIVYYHLLAKHAGDMVARQLTLVVRAAGEPALLAPSLRQAVWDLDPNLPIARVRTLEAVVQEARAPAALTAVMLLLAAAVALGLGAVGTFGVISYLVSQRTAEIGVRMALGARRADIRLMVLRQGMLLAAAGAAVGMGLALASTRWLEALLYEIQPRDLPTFLVVPAVLLAVAALATWWPASRAARIEPVIALRQE
jgi:predicted permease